MGAHTTAPPPCEYTQEQREALRALRAAYLKGWSARDDNAMVSVCQSFRKILWELKIPEGFGSGSNNIRRSYKYERR